MTDTTPQWLIDVITGLAKSHPGQVQVSIIVNVPINSVPVKPPPPAPPMPIVGKGDTVQT